MSRPNPITGTTMDNFPENFRSKLKEEWLDSCIAELNISNLGFDNFDLAEKEKLIFERFLLSDMKFFCGGVLPENIHTFDLAHLPGPLVLQVNEMVDTSVHPEDRRLLLTMTDGVRYILGVEIRPIKDLQVSAPAGVKVLIHKGSAFDGLLQLVPEGLEVLGGMVEDLGAERKKSVEEVIESPKVERMQTDVAALKPKDHDEIVKDNSNRLTDEYKAMPYTYLTGLLAEWEQRKKADDRAPIRRKIQGMMTGLSKFKFSGRTEYELVVQFDDGSCTSDVVIHHDVVQRQLGLTPAQLSEFFSTVSGDESDDDGWEIMMAIQNRLSSLQCTLVVEIDNNSNVPVAVEVDSTVDLNRVMEKRLQVGYGKNYIKWVMGKAT